MAIPLADKRVEVKASGPHKKMSYRIATNSKSFYALSTGIYSHPIAAVVRELGTNAYDAHVYVGKADMPFDVHLPSNYEPTFWVRDYGPGIDEEDMEDVYTVYFESGAGKLESNDVVGCHGLGSKSPFSISETFTIISFQKGTKKIYSACKDDEGEPHLILLETDVTDEPDGLLVELAVDRHDNYDFTEAAKNVYRYFDVKPNFVGPKKPTIEEFDYVLTGDGWGIYKLSNTYGAESHTKVLMGNIAYPIDKEQVDKKYYSLLRVGIGIRCEIGSLAVTLAREKLEYNKATVRNLERRLDEVLEDIGAKAEEEVDKCESFWAACCLMRTWKGSMGRNHSIFRDCVNVNSLSWKGEDLSGGKINLSSLSSKGIKVVRIAARNSRRYDSSRGGYSTVCDVDETLEIHPSDKVVIYLSDMAIGCAGRIKSSLKLHSVAYLVSVNPGFDEKKALKAFKKIVHCVDSDLIRTSSLPKPPKNSKYNRGASITKVFKFTGNLTDVKADAWEEVDVDMDNGGIYVAMKRADVEGMNGVGTLDPDIFQHILSVCRLANIDLSDLVAVRKPARPAFKRHKKWTEFWGLVSVKLQEHFDTVNITQCLRDHEEWTRYEQDDEIKHWVSKTKTTKNSVAGRILAKMNASLANKKHVASRPHHIRTTCSYINYKIATVKPTIDLDKATDAMIKKYPMTKYVIGDKWENGAISSTECVRRTEDYIQLIEGGQK
jgi:hypothetical protein